MKNLLAAAVLLDKQTVRIDRLVRSCVDCGATRLNKNKHWYKKLGGYQCNRCYWNENRRRNK